MLNIVKHFYSNKETEYIMNRGGQIITLKFVMEWGNACKFRIVGPNGDTSQAVFLPTICLQAKENSNELECLYWFWNRKNNKHKLRLAGYEL